MTTFPAHSRTGMIQLDEIAWTSRSDFDSLDFEADGAH
jgi:hypothetical protein